MIPQQEDPHDKAPADGPGEPARAGPFQSIVAEAEEGVLILGPDGLINYANPAAEFLLGQGQTDLLGEMFGFPRAVLERTTTVNVISGDGQVRLVELRVEPLPSGPSGSQVLRLKDITSYHRDVTSAREQIRRRDEFLAMLSHEIRNPLAAIRSATLLLVRDELPGDIRRTAGEVLNRQFKHLERILADLLDITRISRGKLEISRERVELNQIIHDAIEAATPLIRRREHDLKVDVPPGAVWVEGDATRLEQVIVNLMNNAAKFTPPGGHITLVVTLHEETVELCVCDDGPGIPEDLRAHIFEPFVQGKQAIDRSEGGLGIGLTLVARLVELHRGEVKISPNEDGRGICVSLRLPLASPAPQAPANPSVDTPRPLRILLVEDNEDTRRMLRQLLQLEGHEVLEASDGAGGLAILLAQPLDVALIDIGLPALNGYELARQVRQRCPSQSALLIALTGYGTPGDIEAAREAGFDSHLIKPLRYPDLCQLLRKRQAGLETVLERKDNCPPADGM